MSIDNRFAGDVPDAELQQVLDDFKASAHAWGEAAYTKPRGVRSAPSWSWRIAAGWALGCALLVGSVSGGMYARHHRHRRPHEVDAVAVSRQAPQQQLAGGERLGEKDADLLATVDSDVSREVPSAMEPLAQLMDDDSNR